MEQLIRDLALGEKPLAELAEIHGLEEQTVRVFKMNHKPEIAAVVADWTSQFDHIWSTKKENRLRVLTQRLEEIEDLIAALYELDGRRKPSGTWTPRPLRCRLMAPNIGRMSRSSGR